MITDGEYQDDLVLSVIRRYDLEREHEKPLGYRIKIGYRMIALADRKIYTGIMMRLPASFRKQTGNDTASGYIMRDHPEVVFTSGCGTVNFTVDRMEHPSLNVSDAGKRFMDAMKADYPYQMIYENGIRKAVEAEVNWFEYRSYSADSEVYNIMFFFPGMAGDVFVSTFKCPWRDAASWKIYVLKMLETIKIQPGEGGKQ